MFIINCKNYEEIAGDRIIKLVKVAERAAKKYKIKIVIAPPQNLIGNVTKSKIPILAQHVDNAKVGSTTGFVIPELLKKSNVKGALINHSEHRIQTKDIESLIKRLRELKMISVVCVKNVNEVKKYLRFEPDYIAIEPPELIGSGRAISKEKPEIIENAASIVKTAKNKTKLLCGAGIISGEDVSNAIKLGSKGILVASGVVKAKDWTKIIDEFSKAML